MTDECTETSPTRMSRRTRQRADVLADGDELEVTRLGSRGLARAAGGAPAGAVSPNPATAPNPATTPGVGTDAAATTVAADTADDDLGHTRLGARRAAALRVSAPGAAGLAVPELPASRVASTPLAPGTPGAAAARERYGARSPAPATAARPAPPAAQRDAAPADADIASLAELGRTARARARRRALWAVAAIVAIILLVTAGILLVTSTLGR